MARQLVLNTRPVFTLPVDPSWREALFAGDGNWRFDYNSMRWMRVLVPYRGARPTISGHIVRLTRTGYVVDVAIDAHRERVTVDGTATSIVPRP